MPDERLMPQAAQGPDRILVARLIRPHGRRGELIAEILTDFPERFHQRPRLILVPPESIGSPAREVELENFWFQRSRVVFKFRGVDSMNDAENLRGYDVAIPAAERAPLEPGAVYVSDLVGCQLIHLNAGSVPVGEVVDVDRSSSSTELLVVRPTGGGSRDEWLIPFVQEYLLSFEPQKREIVMRLPEGLLEINAPMTEEEKRHSQQQSRQSGRQERGQGRGGLRIRRKSREKPV